MKLKIIKKMLAAMIATSTIITTPGLANASKKISEKKSEQSGALIPKDQTKKKKLNRKRKKHNTTQKYKNIYRHILSQIRHAMHKKSYTPTDKQEFAKSVNLMIENGWVSGWTKNSLYYLIKILNKCANEPSARKFVVDSLVKLTSGDYLRQYSAREFLTIAGSLKDCLEDQTLKQPIAIALNNLTSNYLIQIPVKDSEVKNFKKGVTLIIDMLYSTADCMEAKVYVAKSFWELTCRGLLDEADQEKISETISALFLASQSPESEQYVAKAVGDLAYRHLLNHSPKEAIFALTDAILKFDLKDEESKTNVAFAVSNLAFLKQFEEYPKDKVFAVVDSLISCASSCPAQKYFANAIVGLFDDELFKSLSKDQLIKITDTLIGCCDDDSAKKYVAFAIGRMAYYGLFKEFDDGKMSKIFEALLKCAKNHKARKHVAIAIANLEQDNFLKGYSKQEILKITDLLLNFDNDSNKNDSDLAQTNQELTINVKNLIMGSKNFNVDGQILAIENKRLNIGGKGLFIGDKKLTVDGNVLDTNAKGVTVEGKNLTIEDNDAFVDCDNETMSEKNVNTNTNEDNTPQEYDDLIEDDEDRIDSNDVSLLVFELARKDLLSQYSDEEISKVIDTFIERVYTFPGEYPNEAANAIEKLASKGLLDKYCEKNLPRITGLLFNLAYDQAGASKESIAKAFGQLAKRGHLDDLCYERISSIFYLLNSFAYKDQAESTQTAVLDAVFELAQKKFLESFGKYDIENIFKLLEKCAIDKPDQTKGRVAKIIFELVSMNCFKEFFQENALRVTELLNLCAQGNCCHDDSGEKHTESDHKYVTKVFDILFDEMFLYKCTKKTIFKTIFTLISCLENDNSCAGDVAKLLLKFAKSGRLKKFSENFLQNVVEMLKFCASHDSSTSKDVAATIKAMIAHNMFGKYSKVQTWKIVEILWFCSQSLDQHAKEEVADAIYELAHAGLFNEYSQFDIQNIGIILNMCANGVGADNHSIQRALDELQKVMAAKMENF